MNTNPDDWWLRRRHPPVGPGDAWSGGGKAYPGLDGRQRRRPGRVGVIPGLLAGEGRRQIARSTRSPSESRCPFSRAYRSRVSGRKRLAVAPRRGRGLGSPSSSSPRSHGPAAGILARRRSLRLSTRRSAPAAASKRSKRRVANWAGPDGKLLSHGRVGRQIAAEEHAGWPSFAGCTALFWRVRAEGASFGGFTAVLSRALAARR